MANYYGMSDDEYQAALDDARYDAAMDAYEDALRPFIDEIVQPIMDRVETTDEDMPHPWTLDRVMLQTWLDEGEDALREELEEEFRDEAEDALRDSEPPGPCCNDFHCPCGNSNNFRGF